MYQNICLYVHLGKKVNKETASFVVYNKKIYWLDLQKYQILITDLGDDFLHFLGLGVILGDLEQQLLVDVDLVLPRGADLQHVPHHLVS